MHKGCAFIILGRLYLSLCWVKDGGCPLRAFWIFSLLFLILGLAGHFKEERVNIVRVPQPNQYILFNLLYFEVPHSTTEGLLLSLFNINFFVPFWGLRFWLGALTLFWTQYLLASAVATMHPLQVPAGFLPRQTLTRPP